MKKALVIALTALMAFGLFTGCGSSGKYTMDMSPYDKLDLAEYVTIPESFDSYEYKVNSITVTDSDVDTEIEARLTEASSETFDLKKGTVDKGDTVTIAFKGTLEDGSTLDGMNSDGTEITLGSAGYIDGFEEGLYGATIGEPVTLKLKFPDPYNNNTDLSGKAVTFEVTVLSKKATVQKELDEDFIKTDSEGKVSTVEEYREYIKKILQDYADSQSVYTAKQSLLSAIIADCKVLKFPEDEVEAVKARLTEQYKSYAESNSVDWETFVQTQFGGQESYDEQLDTYVRDVVVSNNLKILALCEKEGITISNKEYNEKLQEILDGFGVKDEEEFQSTYNMTFSDYITSYDVNLNMYATKFLDKITKTGEFEEKASE